MGAVCVVGISLHIALLSDRRIGVPRAGIIVFLVSANVVRVTLPIPATAANLGNISDQQTRVDTNRLTSIHN